MPPNVHRAAFVPSPIGAAYVSVDVQGRIVVPKELRGSFGARRPPFSILYSLSRPGYAAAYPGDAWPPRDERLEVERTLGFLGNADPGTFAADQLTTIQAFARLVACRYLDATIDRSWQVRIPEVVRAWLGLSTRAPAFNKARVGRGRQRESVVVIGNFAGLEIWSGTTFKDAVLGEMPRFGALRAEATQILRHSDR